MVLYGITNHTLADFWTTHRIPEWVRVRLPYRNEMILEPSSGVGFYTVFFAEGKLSLPLDPLFVDFFNFFEILPAQCAPNVFRILGGIIALRDLLSLPLGLPEIRYCYGIKSVPRSSNWYLSARHASRGLVFNLPSSDKGYDGHWVIVDGPVTHAPRTEYQGLEIPTTAGTVGQFS